LRTAGLRERAALHPTDMLDDAAALPSGMDIVWMSQFLSCFSEQAIASIFRRVAAALAPRGQVLVMDTFWDRQRYDIAAYCLINTSPYFNNIASGNSKVYESDDYIRLARAAGLELVTARDGIGYCHSLLRFARMVPSLRTARVTSIMAMRPLNPPPMIRGTPGSQGSPLWAFLIRPLYIPSM